METTVASLAEAVEAFLLQPPPIPERLFRPDLSFRQEILNAYEAAVA
jgi:hypothetical protein